MSIEIKKINNTDLIIKKMQQIAQHKDGLLALLDLFLKSQNSGHTYTEGRNTHTFFLLKKFLLIDERGNIPENVKKTALAALQIEAGETAAHLQQRKIIFLHGEGSSNNNF